MTIPATHKEATAQLRERYAATLAIGEKVPFVYPVATVGAAVGVLFFLIPPTSSLHNRFTRYLTFAFILGWHLYIVQACLGMNPSSGFGAGGISTFGTMWAGVLLVFNDAKTDFKRIQRRPPLSTAKASKVEVTIDSSAFSNRPDEMVASELQQEYYWQPYPVASMRDRVYWTLDLWTNFRLTGWDHMLKTMPTYPLSIQEQLNRSLKKDSKTFDQPMTRTGLRRFDNLGPLVRQNAWLFVKGYIILDLLCTLTRHDAYFRGLVDAPPPASLPEFMLAAPGFWVRSYRMIIGMIFIWLGLRNVLVLAPLCIAGLISDKVIGTWAEPWLYPDHFGKFTVVLDNGLAGWWGGWWHQSFRCAFLSASNWLTDKLGVARRSSYAKIITLLVSFFLSGLMHAGGSMTQPGPTNSLKGPLLFFMLQPLGLAAETVVQTVLRKVHISQLIPAWLSSIVNFIWVYVSASTDE